MSPRATCGHPHCPVLVHTRYCEPLDCSPYGGSEVLVTLACISLMTNDNASLVAWMVKKLPAMWATCIRSLGWEDPLEKEMAT